MLKKSGISMMTMQTERKPNQSSRWPVGLTEWLEPDTLLGLTLRATTERSEFLLGCSQWCSGPVLGRMAVNLRSLLSLLTYCYATGIYASSQVEQKVHQDPALRYLAARQYPNQHLLRLFRRRWRLLLHGSLVLLLALAWERHQRGQSGTSPNQATEAGDDLASLPPEVVRDCMEEAQRRLDWAAQLDSMELDD